MDGQQDGRTDPNETTWQFQPGETISPRSTPPPSQPAAPVAGAAQPAPPEPAAAPPPVTPPADTQPAAQPPTPAAEPATPPEQPPAPPEPTPTEQPTPEAYAPPTTDNSITWTASEFIAHHKSAAWHLMLVAASIVLAVIIWFLTKDVVTPAVVILAGVVLSFYGGRQPDQLEYRLDDHGLTIGRKHFLFSDFRAFSIMPEGAFQSIALIPTKRFAPLTSLYFDPDDGERIVGILGVHLPHQDRRPDAVDSLMRRIRF